jgi:hypothetical protein
MSQGCSTVLIGTVLFVAGCAAPYVPPQAGPVAKLRIISVQSNNNFVKVGTDPNCISGDGATIATLGINANRGVNQGYGGRVGVPLPTNLLPKQTTEIVIPAEQAYSIEGSAVSFTGTGYSFCKAMVTFKPIRGESYEAIFDQVARHDCTFQVSHFVQRSSGEWVRQEVTDQKSSRQICR